MTEEENLISEYRNIPTSYPQLCFQRKQRKKPTFRSGTGFPTLFESNWNRVCWDWETESPREPKSSQTSCLRYSRARLLWLPAIALLMPSSEWNKHLSSTLVLILFCSHLLLTRHLKPLSLSKPLFIFLYNSNHLFVHRLQHLQPISSFKLWSLWLHYILS